MALMYLPVEIKSSILQHVECCDLLNIAGVSSELRLLASRLLWRKVDDFGCLSPSECTQFARILNLTPHLARLIIERKSLWTYKWPRSIPSVELDSLTYLSLQGDEDFVLGWLSTITAPALRTLCVKCRELESPGQMLAVIGAKCNLHHLHIQFTFYDSAWSLPDMITWLDELTELTTFQFLANVPDCEDPESLTDDDARTIIQLFPNLRVLAVALATFDFFIQVLELPHLEDLTLNAYFWFIGNRDTGTTHCPGLRSLRFSGSPDHWVSGPAGSKIERYPCPDTLKMERFPHMTTLEVVAGTGDILGDPSWA